MEVGFVSAQMAAMCSSPAQTRRKWGAEGGRKIRLRLDQMAAAATLAELESLPQVRCRPLGGDGDERFAVEVGQDCHLVVLVDGGPTLRRNDGRVDHERVDRLLVVEITGGR